MHQPTHSRASRHAVLHGRRQRCHELDRSWPRLLCTQVATLRASRSFMAFFGKCCHHRAACSSLCTAGVRPLIYPLLSRLQASHQGRASSMPGGLIPPGQQAVPRRQAAAIRGGLSSMTAHASSGWWVWFTTLRTKRRATMCHAASAISLTASCSLTAPRHLGLYSMRGPRQAASICLAHRLPLLIITWPDTWRRQAGSSESAV